MKNLETGATMLAVDGFLTERLSAASRIDVPRYRWNLAEIASIVTTDTLASAEARAAAVRQARTRRTLTGAAIGGAVDFTMGSDSIIDGVLLGAAFGFLTADTPEKITAKVGVIFTDGEALSLEVDAKEYALLQTAAHRALAQPDGAGESPARTSCEVGLYDAEDVLGRRHAENASNTMILMLFGGAALVVGGTILPVVGQLNGKADTLLVGVVGAAKWLGLAGILFGLIYRIFPFHRLESYLLDDAERQAFERLKEAASTNPAVA